MQNEIMIKKRHPFFDGVLDLANTKFPFLNSSDKAPLVAIDIITFCIGAL